MTSQDTHEVKPAPNMNLIHKRGGAIKARLADDGATGYVEGYLVSWGNDQDTDLQGEFFSPRTEFCLDWFKERPVLYHHGLDGEAGLRSIGTIKTVETDDLGLWVQAQLDLRDRYASAVYDMIKSKEFGWSSGSVDHLVQISAKGEIAVWPLIEGSITPTPAQPAKTSVRVFKSANIDLLTNADPAPTTSFRAFKAILSGNAKTQDYLRGLIARVESFDGQAAAKSFNTSITSAVQRQTIQESSAKRLARIAASALGYKTSEDELNQAASQMESQVDEEVGNAAAAELEMEAALQYLEEEMVQVKGLSHMPQNRTTRNTRPARGYRSDELGDVDSMLSEQVDDITSTMAASIAADIEDEVSAIQAEDAVTKAIARQIRRKALAQALKLDALDDAGDLDVGSIDGGGEGADDAGSSYLGDLNRNSPEMKRVSARRARRSEDMLPQEPVMADDAFGEEEVSVMMETVAQRAYNHGMRKGMQQAWRATEDTTGQELDFRVREDNSETGNVDTVPEAGGSEMTVASLRRAKAALSKLRRAMRGEELGGDELAAMADEIESLTAEVAPSADPAAIQASRALSRARRALSKSAYRSEGEDDFGGEAVMADEDVTAEEVSAARAFQRGYAKAMARARKEFGADQPVPGMDDAAMAEGDEFDPEAIMSEGDEFDPEAIMSDDDMVADEEAVASYRSVRKTGRNVRAKSATTGYSSYDTDRQTQYWMNRAMKAENLEAPGQRNFGNARVTRDQADQPGAYNHAFKSYLYKGLGLMTDTEKYTLTNKGKVEWKGAKSFSDPRGLDPRVAAKTYFSGTDASAGFAVPPDWVNELNKNVMTQTVMAPECRTRTTTSDQIIQPNLITTDARRAHAAQIRWPGEVISNSDSHRSVEDQYSQISVPIHVMMISLTAGNSALEDVTFSLEDEINESFSEAVAIAYDQLIWAGDGQGKLEGVVVNDQVVGHRSTGLQTVSGYIPSGSPDGIVTADVMKEMLFHLPRQHRQRAKWYMNSNTGLQLATLKDGEGNYLIDQRDSSLQEAGVPDRLFGKPIVYNEWADDATTGNFPVILGDLSRGYLIGKRVDFSIRRFDDASFAQYDQVLFLGRARIGGQVLTPAALKVLKIAAS